MASEYPPLNRIHVVGYSANDQNYPILNLVADPRVAGYQVPKDLSACPDKRYPNHVFTGAQPISGDQRVRHVWEILPSPWVPFTRYDDDLGPIQGRRRSVKNEGQVASLASDKRVTYEAREGSAIVYTELEETWSIKVDEDGNSLFPIRDRDFYDASRGPVQERRQLFVPTGEEEGGLENVNGVITQTSYEPYNEFLSVKIVQTYKVDGPQLIGKATDNDGQLVTVTAQRKGAKDYVAPAPTATRTVEVSREDAESLVERIVDTPEIFKANTFSVERPDPIPQKFRVAVPIQSSQEIIEGTAGTPTLEEGEISKSEEQRNKFIKRVSSTSRDQTVLPQTLTGKTTNNERQEVTITETLQLGNTTEVPTATKTVESEALGDGNYVITKTEVDEVFSAITLSKERPDPVPLKFRVAIPSLTRQENLEGDAEEPNLITGEIVKSEQQINQFVKRISTTSRDETKLPQSLTQKTTTNEKIFATVTETLQSGDTEETPTATKTVESEALGDGSYVVRITQQDGIFNGKAFSIERPDPLPQKFRVAARTKTTAENSIGQVSSTLSLSDNELSKSDQQVDRFIKRRSTTSRDQNLPISLTQKETNENQQIVTVTERVQSGDTSEVPSATRTISSEALGDGNYLVRRTQIPKVFAAKTFRKTKDDTTPAKFRAKQEETVEEETVEGIATADFNIDEDGVFSKSEQQLTEFIKRISTTSRTQEPVDSLTEQVLTNEGQLATRTITLSSGDQTITPSATTIDANVEALGDGRTVKTETKVPQIFKQSTAQSSREDLTPSKFRAKQPELRREFLEEGVVDPNNAPPLPAGQFLRSEQQVTEFVKRIAFNYRDVVPTLNIEERVLTPRGQLATRKLILSSEPQTIQPRATLIEGSIEEIGDGRLLKTEVEVDKVFNEKSVTSERPDTIPAKFRAGRTEITEEFVEEKEGDLESAPELVVENGEYRKTQQRVTEFTQRTVVNKKNDALFDPIDAVDYENSFGLKIPFVESIVDEIPQDITADVESLGNGKYLVRDYDLPALEQELDKFNIEYPTRINLNLPRVLKSISVDWDQEDQIGEYSNENFLNGTFKSVSLDDRGTVSSTLAATPKFNIDIEEIWGQNLPAKTKIFFVQGPVVTDQDILSKSGASQQWPVFKPQSHTITAIGKKAVGSASVSVSSGLQITNDTSGTIRSRSKQLERSASITPVVVNIPPCLNEEINISSDGGLQRTITTTASISVIAPISQTATLIQKLETEIDQSIPATSPTDVPRNGIYLIDSDIEFFKFGWFIVRATIFDASQLA